MTTRTETRKIPTPLYAAAGATDLAYSQLRKLPERVAELRGRVAELKPVVSEAVAERNLRADLDKLRDTAKRNAAAFVTSAQHAQEKAVAVYTDLVARGERVVASARTEAPSATKPKAKTGEIKTEPATIAAKAPGVERATAAARPRSAAK